MLDEYYFRVISLLKNIRDTQSEKITLAAKLAADTVKRDGLIYIFGCCHSHLLAEDAFYRAGGLASVSPILYEPLMMHESATRSSVLEKEDGLAEKILAGYPVTEKDMMICVSTSGVNAVPVEMAIEARKNGLRSVAVTSSEYFQQKVKNAAGKHLYEVCDLWIDNFVPHGDTCLKVKNSETETGSLSTILSSFILNSLLAEAVFILDEEGVKAPVYRSGNVEGGQEYNKSVIARFKKRIKHL
ncbi:MAG: SIS domain-containing protein [Bacillota bacterium]|nr:SIS domain-containing protein [Bacillota bacterium]